MPHTLETVILPYAIALAIVALIITGLYRLCRWGSAHRIPDSLDTSPFIQHTIRHLRVGEKQVNHLSSNHRQYLVELIYDDGEVVWKDVGVARYDSFIPGERLIQDEAEGRVVLSSPEGDEGLQSLERIAPFLLDDFDSALDVPAVEEYEPTGLFSEEDRRESTPEEAQWAALLLDNEPLPPITRRGEAHTGAPPAYPPHALLSAAGVPPFLRRLPPIQELFVCGYRSASQKLLSSVKSPPRGRSVQRLSWKGSDFQAVITLTELAAYEDYHIEAVFLVNTEEIF